MVAVLFRHLGSAMKRALVTGSAGFVGRHVLRELRERGYATTRIDIAERVGPREARDYFRTSSDRFDLVVHLAAVVGGRRTIEGEPLAVAVDLSIDAELYGWALRTRPGRIVYYSSSAAYPVRLQSSATARPLREDDIDLEDLLLGAPDLSYGWAKLSGEMLARWAEAEGLRVHVFRPFSGYGSDQDPAYPFRAFVDRALAYEDPFSVWGDGRQVRDFVHIDDVVAATFAAIDADYPGPLNLCTGRPTDFLELADLVTTATGYDPRIKLLEAEPRGVQYRVGDPTKMLEVYRPRVTLEEGIARALGLR
jgi:nucleoside-diphosphate-sugar epimerase